ncbi:hypothetical protein, partial [Microbacterium sp. NPDC086615]|uniref:hypothetical protein n=2 Tax=unclassified Microbacterium TaxID=2609290 RepID=UPI0034311A91
MMTRVQKRSLTILIVLIVIVVVGGYAVLTSGVLAFIFDPDVEAAASTGVAMTAPMSGICTPSLSSCVCKWVVSRGLEVAVDAFGVDEGELFE